MLKDRIKILSQEESSLLRADKLPKRLRNETGLYLTLGVRRFIAYDYSERQSWIGYFGNEKNAPEGHIKEFDNPLDAVDWLLR